MKGMKMAEIGDKLTFEITNCTHFIIAYVRDFGTTCLCPDDLATQ